MNSSFLPTSMAALLALALAALIVHALRHLARRRRAALRKQSYRLIHALKAYSAWIEYQRDLPFAQRDLEEMISPEPIVMVREIKRDWFPQLHTHVLRLLKAHHRLVQYLWEHSMMRLSQGSGWVPPNEDPAYQQLRAEQEDLIDEMIDTCRRATGDADRPWRRTASDFNFSNNGLRTGPPSRA